MKAPAAPQASAKAAPRSPLATDGDGTLLTYKATATVGGKLAQIGSRLIDGVAKKMSDDFFAPFNATVAPATQPAPAVRPFAGCRYSTAAMGLGRRRNHVLLIVAVLGQGERGARRGDADVVIIGAGAAGMLCAIEAGKRGRRVLLIDHAQKLGEKIRISGGGRCNFTNLDVRAGAFSVRESEFLPLGTGALYAT